LRATASAWWTSRSIMAAATTSSIQVGRKHNPSAKSRSDAPNSRCRPTAHSDSGEPQQLPPAFDRRHRRQAQHRLPAGAFGGAADLASCFGPHVPDLRGGGYSSMPLRGGLLTGHQLCQISRIGACVVGKDHDDRVARRYVPKRRLEAGQETAVPPDRGAVIGPQDL
jgi:hypothetical protein